MGETQEWAYHPRGAAWIAMSAAVALGCLALTRVPSASVAAMAGILAAGAAGNGVAAIVWERGMPNPVVMVIGQAVIAFNLADIFTLVGVLLLMVGAQLGHDSQSRCSSSPRHSLGSVERVRP